MYVALTEANSVKVPPLLFQPLRLLNEPIRAGLKGAARSGKHGAASTGTTEGSEARSEPRDRSERGLSRCVRSHDGGGVTAHSVKSLREQPA